MYRRYKGTLPRQLVLFTFCYYVTKGTQQRNNVTQPRSKNSSCGKPLAADWRTLETTVLPLKLPSRPGPWRELLFVEHPPLSIFQLTPVGRLNPPYLLMGGVGGSGG